MYLYNGPVLLFNYICVFILKKPATIFDPNLKIFFNIIKLDQKVHMFNLNNVAQQSPS